MSNNTQKRSTRDTQSRRGEVAYQNPLDMGTLNKFYDTPMFEEQNRQNNNSLIDITDRSIDSGIKNQLVMVPSSEISNNNDPARTQRQHIQYKSFSQMQMFDQNNNIGKGYLNEPSDSVNHTNSII